jgi:Flp pilus assembly protein TadB
MSGRAPVVSRPVVGKSLASTPKRRLPEGCTSRRSTARQAAHFEKLDAVMASSFHIGGAGGRRPKRRISERSLIMLWTIVVILLILWLLGWVVYPIGGGLIHLLLVIALIVVVVRLLQGRRVL